ncbi:alpha-N-acetylgalactosaminidase-like [Ostrinia nubilalis]|uniref:alpha-N-acetylgalactosaminidase-like n=1 Tax=Ostrinia nubilalis TaxID=29057 RepID=UPI00308222F8
MYTNVAAVTCMQYPGSFGHFRTDAKTFADWGVDYLKVDGCFVGEDVLNKAYIKLGSQLNDTGRPMVYSCSWPYYIQYIHSKVPDFEAISQHCNMWRNYHDVQLYWPALKMIFKHFEDEYEELSRHHGPGKWNDPDMLIFGTDTLTESQSRVQIAVYVMLSAPLLLSCDMTKITAYEKKLLQNLDLMAVGQDPLGVMARPHKLQESVTLWVKRHLPMKGNKFHSYSFAIVNVDSQPHLIYFFPKIYGTDSKDGYTVMDVFSRDFIKNVTFHEPIEVTVPPDDVIMYTFFPL